jgi:hypothetical protein
MNELKVKTVKKTGVYEIMYDLSTANPAIHCLIYSTIPSGQNNEARDAGKDAVRVQLWIKTEDEVKFKNFKTHYRTENFFKNLAKTIDEVQEYVNGDLAKKWLWAANKTAREKVKAEQKKAANNNW